MADATLDKTKEGASAPGHRLDGQDGKRSKGSGAVANRRRKGEPGTWQCPECARVINDNPSAKQQHWDSIYCQATRLCNQHGGSWWDWKAKVEKMKKHSTGTKETWHLKENPKSKGQQQPPEPAVPPRSSSLSSWYDKPRYDWDYVTFRSDRERSHLRDRGHSRSGERRRRRSHSTDRRDRRRRAGSRERARSSGRNRERERSSDRNRERARSSDGHRLRGKESVRDATRRPRCAHGDDVRLEKVASAYASGGSRDKKEAQAAGKRDAKEKTNDTETKEPRTDKVLPEQEAEGGSSDYAYTYESSSTGEDGAKETPSVPATEKAQNLVSAKTGAGKKPGPVASAPAPVAAASGAPALGSKKPTGKVESVERLSLLYNSFLRTAMEAVHGMESGGQ